MTFERFVQGLPDRGIVTEMDYVPKMDGSFEARFTNVSFKKDQVVINPVGKGKTRTEALKDYIRQIQQTVMIQTDETNDYTKSIYLWENIIV